MNRRDVAKMLALSPLAAAPVAAAPAEPPKVVPVRRVSVESGDAGESIYYRLVSAGKRVRIFIDGIENEMVVTADADAGFAKVYRSEEEIRAGSWPIEIVHGDVRIVIEEAKA